MSLFDQYIAETEINIDKIQSEYINILEDMYNKNQDELEEAYSFIEEGANLDMLKVYRQFSKDYRSKCTEINKLVRAKSYGEAIGEFKSLKKIIDEAESDVRKIDANSVSALLCGTLLRLGSTFALSTLSGLCGAAIGAGMFSYAGEEIVKYAVKTTIKNTVIPVAGVMTVIQGLIRIVNGFKELENKKTENPKEAFNINRQYILDTFKECRKAIDKWEDALKYKKKEYDNERVIIVKKSKLNSNN